MTNDMLKNETDSIRCDHMFMHTILITFDIIKILPTIY